MVIPISPHTQCSSDTRPPIRPMREFPFSNCFHWLGSLLYIRMRRHGPDRHGVDASRAIRLDSDQNHATSWTFKQDLDRMNALRSQSDRDESSSIAAASDYETIHAVPEWALLDPVVREACSPVDFSEKRRQAVAGAATNHVRRPPLQELPPDLVVPFRARNLPPLVRHFLALTAPASRSIQTRRTVTSTRGSIHQKERYPRYLR